MIDQRWRPWLWATWFAWVAGLSQSAAQQVAHSLFGRLLFSGRDSVWMSSVANTVIFVGAAALLSIATRRATTQRRQQIEGAAFIFLALLGPMRSGRIHYLTAVLIAAGIAWQASRLLIRYSQQFSSLCKRTLPFLIGATVVLAVSVHLRGAQPSSDTPARGPNVLLIVIDTLRAQNLSAYGYGRPTSPAFDRFAASGVTFTKMFSTSSWTLPAHGSLFTGRMPHDIGTDWLSPLNRTSPTLAEVFRKNGYATAGFVANLTYTTTDSGLDRGFVHYEDIPVSPSAIAQSSWLARALLGGAPNAAEDNRLVRKSAVDINDAFLRWLSKQPAERPVFAFLNYFDTHGPYLLPPDGSRKFADGAPLPDADRRRSWSDVERQRTMDAYDDCISYVDAQLGKLLDDLGGRGWLDNTIVIVTSDHGEQFSEHGLYDHANSLYRQALHVPLAISFPARVPHGVRVDAPVSLIDLPATIATLALGASDPLQGRSLAPLWSAGGARADAPLLSEISKGINTAPWLPISHGAMQSIVAEGYHLIRRTDGEELLYDVAHDFDETHDLVHDPAAADVLARLRRQLDAGFAGTSR